MLERIKALWSRFEKTPGKKCPTCRQATMYQDWRNNKLACVNENCPDRT